MAVFVRGNPGKVADVIRQRQAETKQVCELLWRGLDKHRAAETLDNKLNDRRLVFQTLKTVNFSNGTLTNLQRQRMERISYGLDNETSQTQMFIGRSYGASVNRVTG